MQARKQLLLLINGLKNVDCDFLFNILAGERQNLDHIFRLLRKGFGVVVSVITKEPIIGEKEQEKNVCILQLFDN